MIILAAMLNLENLLKTILGYKHKIFITQSKT